jgi:ribose transport system substrate-binding protein
MFRFVKHPLVGLAWWVVVGVAGCVGPPPAELESIPHWSGVDERRDASAAAATTASNAAPEAPQAASSKTLSLILITDDTPDAQVWLQIAMREAGKGKAIFRVSKLNPGDPPGRQAELIREAAARGASALVVEPADAPEVADALGAVQAQGVPVVVLDRSVPGTGKPFPLFTFPPFRDSARKLVQAVVEDAKLAKRSEKGPALLLVNGRKDTHTDDRAAALKAALHEAGVTLLDTLVFDGIGTNALKSLQAALDSHPEVNMVVFDEDQGAAGCFTLHLESHDKYTINIAGYVSFENNVNMASQASFSAVVDRNVQGLVRQAVQAALSLIQGQTVPARTEVELPFFRSRPKTSPEQAEEKREMIDNIIRHRPTRKTPRAARNAQPDAPSKSESDAGSAPPKK